MSPARLAPWFAVLFPLGANADPVALATADFADAVQPQVAVAPDGQIAVVFGQGNAIYHTGSADGRAFSPPARIGELDKLALRMRRGPRIVATKTALVVTAISHTDGDVHAWTSSDRGATWQERARLNEVAHSAREGLHAMAGDGRDLVITAWLDLRHGRTELWSRTSRDAGATWELEVRIYASPEGPICQCCHPSLAIGPRGEIAAMWRNSLGGARDPWMAMSHDGGRHFEPAQKIGAGTWKLNACPMDGGAIAISSTGKTASVWRREKSVFVSTKPNAEDQLAESAAQPVAAFAGSELFLIWEESGALKIRRGTTPPRLLAAGARAPSVAPLPADCVIVVWESTAGGRPSLQSEIISP